MVWFNKLYEKKISATGLSAFRIAFFLNLFFEVFQLFRYRHLYFDRISFVEESSVNMSFFILVWIFVLVFIVLGLFTKICTIINYIFCVVIFSSFTDFEYHMHYVYVGVSFFTMFMPLAKFFSLQNLFFKEEKEDKFVSVLYYYLPILLGIGFVYFDSVFHKLTSKIWLNGLGVWFPASLPQITILRDQWLLNQEGVVIFLGYLTFIFEGLFIFFFWVKKLRIPIFIIGIGLHIGILLEFPIPNFAFGMMALYVLILPVRLWDKLKDKSDFFKLKNRILSKKEKLSFNTKTLLMVTVLILCLLQVNVTLQSPFIKPTIDVITKKINIKNYYDRTSNFLMKFSTKAFGITKHPVFMDNHFEGYHHILSIVYVDELKSEILLPIINNNGMVDSYLSGAIWVNWSYRVNSPNVELNQLKSGLFSYTSYWAHENNIDLTKAIFKIKVKRIDLPNWKWEANYLSKQINKPWQYAGYVIWSDVKPELVLVKPIEEF